MDDAHDKHMKAHGDMMRIMQSMPRREPDFPPWLCAAALVLAALALMGIWKILELMSGK
jgi:hypothetical protein